MDQKYHRVLLIDDIYTTGSTIDTIAKQLLEKCWKFCGSSELKNYWKIRERWTKIKLFPVWIACNSVKYTQKPNLSENTQKQCVRKLLESG